MPFKGIRGDTVRLLDGNSIPLVGLGTYGLWKQADVDRAVDAALANGYRLFDTANFYRNERELGNAFKKFLPKYNLEREDIYIVTKANIRSPDVEENARQMVQNSLDSLQTKHIDLLLIHYPKDWGTSDKNPKNAEHRLRMYRVFEQFKDAGHVRSLGVSNFEPVHIDQLWDEVKHRPMANQCEFHPNLTRPELVAYCRLKGIFFQAHTSLANQAKLLYKNPILTGIAQRHQANIPQVLLAFAYQQGIGVIPKSGNAERIASNMGMLEAKLTAEEIDQLNGLNRNQHYSDCDGWNVL